METTRIHGAESPGGMAPGHGLADLLRRHDAVWRDEHRQGKEPEVMPLVENGLSGEEAFL